MLVTIWACNKTEETNNITTIEFPEGFTQEFEATSKTGHQTMNEGIIDLSKNSNIRVIITLSNLEPGNYKTVDIANQTWMAENLRTRTYNDGSPIFDYYSNSNHPTPNPEISNVFYQGKVLTVSKNVCPAGWHVPTAEDWNELKDYHEEEYSGALKLKTTTGWAQLNIELRQKYH